MFTDTLNLVRISEDFETLHSFILIFLMDRLLPNGQTPREANFEKRAKFTPQEDAKLRKLVNDYGSHPNWRSISAKMKTRTPRQCRERFQNYLNPNIKVNNWTEEENQIILDKYKEFGNQWNKISQFIEGRTGNAVRNQFQLLTRHQMKNRQKGIVTPQKEAEVHKVPNVTQFDALFDLFAVPDTNTIFNQDPLFTIN